ncbi:MAG: thioredoxin domain-containing protein, partial [Actinomycetota bacterium]
AQEIAIAGDASSVDSTSLLDEVRRRYLPNRVLAAGRSEGSAVPLLRDRPQREGRATAYVCERFVCKQPVTEPEELGKLLDAR